MSAERRDEAWREGRRGPERVGSSVGGGAGAGSGVEGLGVGSTWSSNSSPAEMDVEGVGFGRDAFDRDGESEGDDDDVGLEGVGSVSSGRVGVDGRDGGRAIEAGSTVGGGAGAVAADPFGT